MKKQYIKLPKLNGQKVRKKYYVSSVIRHPAKGNIPMMIWILEEFIKDGDIVLDPMAGIGTTLLEGMRLFPNSLFIGIELEHKFVKWCNASIKKTERIAWGNWFMKIGRAVCLQGDARDLERVMKQKVDKIISSPPYSNVVSDDKEGPGAGANEKKYGRWKKGTAKKQSYTQLNEPSKVDKIISSPPFGGQVQHKTNYLGKQKQESGFEYSEGPENIGNLPHGKVDKVISSPPYEGTVSPFTGGAPMPEDKGPHIGCRNIRTGYTKDRNNLGNTKGKTYLEAMLLVYQQCFKVLKPDGLMILITKDFIRNKKRVRLGEDTIKLCEMAGFKHFHTYYRKIENPSFWRTLYQQKYPEVEKIDCEDVIILKK